MTTRDFLWRWDTDWFWCSRHLALSTRSCAGCSAAATQFAHLPAGDALEQPLGPDARLAAPARAACGIGDPGRRHPAGKAAQAFSNSWRARIGIWPVWICPLRAGDPQARFTLYPLAPGRPTSTSASGTWLRSAPAPGRFPQPQDRARSRAARRPEVAVFGFVLTARPNSGAARPRRLCSAQARLRSGECPRRSLRQVQLARAAGQARAEARSEGEDPAAPGAEREAALAQYRRRAGIYDLELALFRADPAPGHRATRAAARRTWCSTSVAAPAELRTAGARRRPPRTHRRHRAEPGMMDRARRRVRQRHWRNLSLLCAPVEDADIAQMADAALFHFTHDILQRPRPSPTCCAICGRVRASSHRA